jgi:ribulose 1,5-bisphosphate synthetase/thiazole synthase
VRVLVRIHNVSLTDKSPLSPDSSPTSNVSQSISRNASDFASTLCLCFHKLVYNATAVEDLITVKDPLNGSNLRVAGVVSNWQVCDGLTPYRREVDR